MKVSRYRNTGINLIILFVFFSVNCQLLTSTTGEITSPNYPDEYQNDLSLSLIIEVPEAVYLRIHFDAFDVESDSDRLYYGIGRQTYYVTGTMIPGDIVIHPGNRVWFYFETNESVTLTGFSLTWSSTGCMSEGK